MPIVINNQVNTSLQKPDVEAIAKKRKYKYSDGFNFTPGTELHDTIVSYVMQRAVESRSLIEDRFADWDRMGKVMRTYKDLSEDEKTIRSGNSNKPVSIVVPVSFAERETILTYLTSKFLGSPIFKYSGVEGMDAIQGAKLELLINLHCHRSKVALDLYAIWQDAITYGIGAGIPYWVKKFGIGTPKEPMSGRRIMWEGNALAHITPYDILPDFNVGVNKVQSGEFFGYVERTNYMAAYSRELTNSSYFNALFIPAINRRSAIQQENTPRSTFEVSGGTTPVDIVNMFMTIIPAELGLGSSEIPEKWIFAIAGDCLLVRAEPLGLFYDEYPVAVAAPLFDEETFTPTSLMERVSGLQKVIDWLLNAHIVNVRKALGIHFVYDPQAINGNDLLSDNPVKAIRMNPSHWGRGNPERYLHQLTISDPSRQNIPDLSALTDIANRSIGVNETMQGFMRGTGEARSATEVNSAENNGFSRVQKLGKMLSMQLHQDIAKQFAYNVQQNMGKDEIVRIVGSMQEALIAEYGQDFNNGDKNFHVTPEDFADLDLAFDIIEHDSVSPGEKDKESWVNVLQPLLNNPRLGGMLGVDVRRVFLHVARQLGAVNAHDFLIKTPQPVSARVVPDEEVLQGEQSGRYIPA